MEVIHATVTQITQKGKPEEIKRYVTVAWPDEDNKYLIHSLVVQDATLHLGDAVTIVVGQRPDDLIHSIPVTTVPEESHAEEEHRPY